MCSNPADLREMANWDGRGTASRQKVIENLQGLSGLLSVKVYSGISRGHFTHVCIINLNMNSAMTGTMWP